MLAVNLQACEMGNRRDDPQDTRRTSFSRPWELSERG